MSNKQKQIKQVKKVIDKMSLEERLELDLLLEELILLRLESETDSKKKKKILKLLDEQRSEVNDLIKNHKLKN